MPQVRLGPIYRPISRRAREARKAIGERIYEWWFARFSPTRYLPSFPANAENTHNKSVARTSHLPARA
jgi:hypothetical protein